MLPHLSFFLHFFITYFVPYVSFPLRIDPLRFQARYYKRQLNLFLCLFCIAFVSYFDWWMRAFVVLGLVIFHTKPRDWLGKTSPKWHVLCRAGRQTTTRSILSLYTITACTYQIPMTCIPSPEPLVLCGAKCHTTLKCPSVPSVDSGDRRVCCWARARAARIAL